MGMIERKIGKMIVNAVYQIAGFFWTRSSCCVVANILHVLYSP